VSSPAVSFVVPAYRLAHLLAECLESILAQSFQDHEILVMDDCSPDDTASVVSRFPDARVRYIRNETNLGHLANYNKGIRLARGRYLWLISADDRLKSTDVLARFVQVLEQDADASFVFCPAMGLRAGVETGIVRSCWSPPDAMRLDGTELLKILLERNVIAAPACLARLSAYHRAGLFPTDLPYAGDWYLWCRFAMDGRVAYLPEPMVHYRLHAASMSESLSVGRPEQIMSDDITVRWRIMHEAAEMGKDAVQRIASACITGDYCARVIRQDAEPWRGGLSMEQAVASIRLYAESEHEASWFVARLAEEVADALWADGRVAEARSYYGTAIRNAPALSAIVKRSLLPLGAASLRLRAAAAAVRNAFAPR
jgi:glycosyltransferase involved in cell wall biosynthesis